VSDASKSIEYPTSLVEGFVLVGGRSTRFGHDKALYPIEDRPMAMRVADTLLQVVASVTLIGEPAKYRHLGLPVIADNLEAIGPLGGISTVLEESDAPWNLIVACDLLHLERGVLERLIDCAIDTAADVVWPVTPDGRTQPLCAVYSKASSDHVKSQVEQGIRKVTDAFTERRTLKLRFDDDRPFFNFNYVNDLAPSFKVPDNAA
jgi:molybdopterin-guanine dinucleotide biosynthesis protein A